MFNDCFVGYMYQIDWDDLIYLYCNIMASRAGVSTAFDVYCTTCLRRPRLTRSDLMPFLANDSLMSSTRAINQMESI